MAASAHQGNRSARPSHRAPRRGAPAFERLLDEALAAGRAAWPQLAVPAAAFQRYVEERLPQTTRDEADGPALEFADLYLCCACALGMANALLAFDERHGATITATLRRLSLPPHFVEEVVQALNARLFAGDAQTPPMITTYSGKGSLAAWLRIVAARTGRRMLGQAKRLVPSSDERLAEDLVSQADSGSELGLIKDKYREPFRHAFAQAMRGLSSREANLLRHRFLDGLTMREVGAIYRVNHTTVSRWIAEIREKLLAATAERLRRDLGIGAAECRSLMRLVHTRLDLTLTAFLRAAAADGAGVGGAVGGDDPR